MLVEFIYLLWIYGQNPSPYLRGIYPDLQSAEDAQYEYGGSIEIRRVRWETENGKTAGD